MLLESFCELQEVSILEIWGSLSQLGTFVDFDMYIHTIKHDEQNAIMTIRSMVVVIEQMHFSHDKSQTTGHSGVILICSPT